MKVNFEKEKHQFQISETGILDIGGAKAFQNTDTKMHHSNPKTGILNVGGIKMFRTTDTTLKKSIKNFKVEMRTLLAIA